MSAHTLSRSGPDPVSTAQAPKPWVLFFRANRRALIELVAASMLVNVFVLSLPLFSMLVYDKAVGNEIHETLFALTAGVLMIFALELCLRISRVFMIEHAGARWDARLDERLMRGVLAAPLSKALPVGDVMGRYRDLSGTRDVLSAQFLLPLADVPFVLLFALVLWAIGGPLVWVPLVMGGLLFTACVLLQKVSRGRQHVANAAHSRKLNWLADVLMTRESLADPRAASVAVAGMRTPSQQGARAASRARLWSQMVQQVLPVGMALTSALTLVAGVFLIEAQALSVGGLISSTLLAGRMVAALCGLAPVLSRGQEFRRAVQGLGEAVNLDAPAIDVVANDASSSSAFALEGLRLEGVAFAYSSQTPGPTEAQDARKILQDVTVALKPAELVVIVGASGAGKSTLLRLLAGHLTPDAGRMAFAAHVIDGPGARRWMAAQVAYKPQDAVFIGGSLSEVVLPGQAVVDEAAVTQALRAAGLGPALDKGELGLTSEVGTNGAGVSGGQRQMLALARVLASDRAVLLLDEPTLGLDRSAQEGLLTALAALRTSGRCVVVATHTTELIQMADRVLVLDKGRIVADAPPSRLLSPANNAMPQRNDRAAVQSPARTAA
jgi:ABC-type bacteriocin/lantibiotic exporter with double-glycine peptidase domain